MGDAVKVLPPAQYDTGLARKRAAASVLFFDQEGRVLLVDPVYKPAWEVPGGAVEADESPLQGAGREVKEELGLAVPLGRMLAMDWVPPRPERSEGIVTVFDGGVLSAEQLDGIRLQSEELRGYRFVAAEEVGSVLTELVARRVRACVARAGAGDHALLGERQRPHSRLNVPGHANGGAPLPGRVGEHRRPCLRPPGPGRGVVLAPFSREQPLRAAARAAPG